MGAHSPQNEILHSSRSSLAEQVSEFLLDRQVRGLSPATIAWYTEKLSQFTSFLSAQGTEDLASLTPSLIRSFLLSFSQTHNPGGTHGAFRAIRALCHWYSDEYETTNPCAKVQAPKVALQPLEAVNLADLSAMLDTCTTKSLADLRDRALLLFLLDSGCRRSEFLALDVADLDMRTGTVIVRHGKGDKARACFIGATTRKAMLGYLRVRRGPAPEDPLWVTVQETRLSSSGLEQILLRRAKRAGVPAPSPHDFRRGFALNSLRAGVDLVSLQRLLGHSSLSIVQRYLKQTTEDLAEAHRKSSPVDRMLGKKGR